MYLTHFHHIIIVISETCANEKLFFVYYEHEKSKKDINATQRHNYCYEKCTHTPTHTQKDTTSQLLHHVCEEFILCITYGGRTCGILILYNYQKQKVQVEAKREANLTANCMETSQPFTIIIAIRI